MTERPLTNKQLAFCREYVKDSNGKQAAIRAGYSAKTAEVKASQLLRLVKIKQETGRIQAETAEKLDFDRDIALLILILTPS